MAPGQLEHLNRWTVAIADLVPEQIGHSARFRSSESSGQEYPEVIEQTYQGLQDIHESS
jgi:hypothetical protein